MSITGATVRTYMEAAIAAQESGDLETAITKARSALMAMSVIPNSENQGDRMEWDRASIQSLIKDLNRQRTASRGIAKSRITYRRLGRDEECE